MEDDRRRAPTSGAGSSYVPFLGGYYAKAKQRVLNKMGKRTSLTRNPRVDYISHKVDEIRTQKANVASLAQRYKSQLKQLTSTAQELNQTLISVWKEELGERKWDADRKVYVRQLHPEETRLVQELEDALKKCNDAIKAVNEAFVRHLDDCAEKPLTFCTPEETARVEAIAETKEDYKTIRTDYSDAVIDMDTELEGGGDARPKTIQRVEETREEYEKASERLTAEALKFESLYRDELSQRVTAHFTAQLHLVRGSNAAYRDFYPFSKSLTLDWQEMRSKRKQDLEAHRTLQAQEDDGMRAHAAAALPGGSGAGISSGKKNPFGSQDDSRELSGTLQHRSSGQLPSSTATPPGYDGRSAVQVPRTFDADEANRASSSSPTVPTANSEDLDFFGLSVSAGARKGSTSRGGRGDGDPLDTVQF